MGKRGSDSAPLKPPASYVASSDGPLSSEVAVAELRAIRNINLNGLRKRAVGLGVVTKYQGSDGQWHHRCKADMLDDCIQALESRTDVGPAEGLNAIKDQALFRTRACQLGLRVRVKSSGGKKSVFRHKADVV